MRAATLIALIVPWLTCLTIAGCSDSERAPAPDRDEVPSTSSAATSEARAHGSKAASAPLSEHASAQALSMSPVPPSPDDPTNRWSTDPGAAELGRTLFHSKALSKNGDMSCATCHGPREHFTDGQKLAQGVIQLERHTPALWNVAHQRWFFWDGRADSLWSQALAPLEDPLEHAFARTEVARTIAQTPQLRRAYESVFGPLPSDFSDETRFPPFARPVPEDDRAHQLAREHASASRTGDENATPHHEHLGGSSGFFHPHQRGWNAMSEGDRELVNQVFVRAGKSIAAFERRIRSSRSDFDVFVEGLRGNDPEKTDRMTSSALRGLELFTGRANCTSCHGGPFLTDLEFHDTRVPLVDGAPTDDPGRSRGIERLLASEFGVRSRYSDKRDGPAIAKVEFLPRNKPGAHAHAPEFKTPSLRNVARTAPYMHNGAFTTLEEVVDFYNERTNLRPSTVPGETILKPLDLTQEECADIVAFLESLTDVSLDPALVGPPKQ